MKNKKLFLDKIQVTKLDNLSLIKGGCGEKNDNETDTTSPPETTDSQNCILVDVSISSLLTEPISGTTNG